MKKDEQKIEIPPGHWILFYQNIIHRVPSGKVKKTQKRLFTGIRITKSKKPLYDNKKLIRYQGSIRMPGGGEPRMLEKNHIRFFKGKAITWSQKTFIDEVIGNDGYVDIHMKSLKEYGLPRYPAYTEEELKILKPTPL